MKSTFMDQSLLHKPPFLYRPPKRKIKRLSFLCLTQIARTTSPVRSEDNYHASPKPSLNDSGGFKSLSHHVSLSKAILSGMLTQTKVTSRDRCAGQSFAHTATELLMLQISFECSKTNKKTDEREVAK
ncbi:unnamed protein product [Ilex paraguariensis]|uniref:Uncharacterized protein n=1 Tax=Ilex paraguariensis TaxID=185542 RepID=A0ABC8TBI8_9AQUA